MTQRAENSSADYALIYSFGSGRDGSGPGGPLLYLDGVLYGTTSNGGDGYPGGGVGSGVVYTVTPEGKERVLHRFKLGNVNGPSGSGVILVGKLLYGTTQDGGTHRCGTVFAMTTTGDEHVLYNFHGGLDGCFPSSTLVSVKGKLYGTTGRGGSGDSGTTFEISTSGHYHTLHQFTYGRGGDLPSGDLTYVNGTLYGTTYSGGGTNCQDVGNLGCGTIFAMAPSGHTKAIYRFKGGSDGDSPVAGLTEWNGLLYGTTYFGGNEVLCPGGCGTVYAFNPVNKRHRVLYRFVGGADGMLPNSSLRVFRDYLYGTTALGGNGGCFPYLSCGTVFRIDSFGNEEVVHAFKGHRNGEGPSSPLTPVNGVLYGTTGSGGNKCKQGFGCGAIYSITP